MQACGFGHAITHNKALPVADGSEDEVKRQ